MFKIPMTSVVIKNLNHKTIKNGNKAKVTNNSIIKLPVSTKRRGNRARKRIKIIKLNTDFIS